MGTAYMRAVHRILDSSPRILDDSVIVTLPGPKAVERITGSLDAFQTPDQRALRAHVVLRSRYAEDRLAVAIDRGVTQYVILGAGLDTFGLRQPDRAHTLTIVEVDHSGTQGMKREMPGLA
jgi:O-methyltransferase involved in polyketide biosynthesis